MQCDTLGELCNSIIVYEINNRQGMWRIQNRKQRISKIHTAIRFGVTQNNEEHLSCSNTCHLSHYNTKYRTGVLYTSEDSKRFKAFLLPDAWSLSSFTVNNNHCWWLRTCITLQIKINGNGQFRIRRGGWVASEEVQTPFSPHVNCRRLPASSTSNMWGMMGGVNLLGGCTAVTLPYSSWIKLHTPTEYGSVRMQITEWMLLTIGLQS